MGTILAYVGLAILEYVLLSHLKTGEDFVLWFFVGLAGRILLSFALGVLLVRLLHAPVKLTKWALGLILLVLAVLELYVVSALAND